MKQSLLSLLIFFSLSTTAQQVTLKVNFVSTKSDSTPAATVQLFILPDTNLVATQVSNSKGNSFQVNKFSKYLLKVTSIGYANTDKSISVADKAVSITIELKRKAKNLDEVVVVSKKPLMRQEDDKTIVEAEALANSSSNAYEVLEKTPGAIVDQDGNVYLNSATPAVIQINGRNVKLSAADIATLLKSLPSGSVSKIEILRNPSAKYDAESSGGIINIVLKKGVRLGSSGSMNVGWFQGVYNTKFAGFSLNKNNDKITSYFSYQWMDKNNFDEISSTRLLANAKKIVQQSKTTYPAISNYFSAGIDKALSKKFNIAVDVRLNIGDNRSDAKNSININNANNTTIGNNLSVITSRNNSFYITNNIYSKYKLDTLGSEFTFQVDYNYYSNNNHQQYNNIFSLPEEPTIFGNGDLKANKNIFTIQTDLIWKLPHAFTLETGYKTISSKSNNNTYYTKQQGNSITEVDNYQTNTFNYKETISSLYFQLSKKIAGFIIKPGIRFEATNIRGNQIIPVDTFFQIKRNDAFPYLFIKHKILKLFGFEINGTGVIRRSITRPYYEALNPYPKYVDQYLFDVGNPYLTPQFTNNYEFNITADEFTIFAIGVNKTKNVFNNVTYQDEATGIAYRTYDNLGNNKEMYLRFAGGIPPGGKYFFYMGGQQNFNTYNGVK